MLVTVLCSRSLRSLFDSTPFSPFLSALKTKVSSSPCTARCCLLFVMRTPCLAAHARFPLPPPWLFFSPCSRLDLAFFFLSFSLALQQGNTPKYGLIFHSSFIGRAGAKHKGRISRYLANKCSMASRIDSFSDVPENGTGISNIYGQKLKEQVEERLEFYKTGKGQFRALLLCSRVPRSLPPLSLCENRNLLTPSLFFCFFLVFFL